MAVSPMGQNANTLTRTIPPTWYLLKNKDELEKTQIEAYLGLEAEYQNGFSLRVLHKYIQLMDFGELVFDDAIRFFLSGFRLPGEAQKVSQIILCRILNYCCETNPEASLLIHLLIIYHLLFFILSDVSTDGISVHSFLEPILL